MNVKELIQNLEHLDKVLKQENVNDFMSYDIRLIEDITDHNIYNCSPLHDSSVNSWLDTVEVSKRGSSGYEQNGEVRLMGSE